MAAQIEFEQTVSYLLAKVSTAFRSSLERQMAQIGLHSGQIFILLELWEKDGQRQIDLARRLNLAAPTVNKTVNTLIEINLVSRERLENDGRSTRIFLTDGGLAMRSQIESQWIDLEESCLVGLSETERLILFDLLGKLRNTYTGREPAGDEQS